MYQSDDFAVLRPLAICDSSLIFGQYCFVWQTKPILLLVIITAMALSVTSFMLGFIVKNNNCPLSFCLQGMALGVDQVIVYLLL